MNCPLCNSLMERVDGMYRCIRNESHACTADEIERFQANEVDIHYLRHRCKIRVGKEMRGK